MGLIFDEVENRILKDRPKDRQILVPFVDLFDVTFGRIHEERGSVVSYYFLRPEEFASELFGFEKDVVLVYSDYDTFETGRLKMVDSIMDSHFAKDRTETICFVLVSDDPKIRDKVAEYNSQRNHRYAIPFSLIELQEQGGDQWFIRQRFSEYIYTRDLFDVQHVLYEDTYFFGRKIFVQDVLDRFRRGENTGVFGLRRSGKTSTLFKIDRVLKATDYGYLVYINAEEPSIYESRWWQVLVALTDEMSAVTGIRINPPEDLSPSNAFAYVRNALQQILDSLPEGKQRLLIAIDEIENILPHVSTARHWNEDFVPMWKSLRALQTKERRIAFLVSGVNAWALEQPRISNQDNPLLGFMTPRYLPPFSRDEVRDMVRSLGKHMGLKFEREAYEYLRTHYGGHPLLIRMACSWHHRKALQDMLPRPVTITVKQLDEARQIRDQSLIAIAGQILGVLEDWYELEFELLQALANGDVELFSEFAEEAPETVAHLREYGLISESTPPYITIAAIGDYLQRRSRPSTRGNENEDIEGWLNILSDINRLRNRLEARSVSRYQPSRFAGEPA